MITPLASPTGLQPPLLVLADLPPQAEVDRALSTYESYVWIPDRAEGRRPWRRWARCGHDRRPRPAHRPLRPGPLLEHLRLHQAAAVLPSWLDRAAAQELSYSDFLHGLLEEAVARAGAATRLREADFPYAATIEQFDFRFAPSSAATGVALPGPNLRRAGAIAGADQARAWARRCSPSCIATKHVHLGATAPAPPAG